MADLHNFSLLSLVLPDTHVPLRRIFTQKNPAWRKANLKVWDPANPTECFPFTVKLDAMEPTQLLAEVKHDPALGADGSLWYIGGSSPGYKYTLQSGWQTLDTVNGITTFPITVIPRSVGPWGFKDSISFQMNTTAGPGYPVAQVNFEIYAVVEDIAPYYMKDGIPIDFLQLFALPTPDKSLQTMNDWIQWAVKRCHASTFDETLKKRDPTTANDAIHSYRYHVWAGASAFTANESTFKLDSWLDNRMDPNRVSFVNCYDQAGLVDCVLNLGLPYKLRDLSGNIVQKKGSNPGEMVDVTTVDRFWKGTYADSFTNPLRFGYINTKDLVGWGDANNPFFGNSDTAGAVYLQDQIFDNAVPHDGRKRWSFRNHKWACIRRITTGSSFDELAADACAGPVFPPTTVTQYLNDVIDAVTSKTILGNTWDQDKHTTLGQVADFELDVAISGSIDKIMSGLTDQERADSTLPMAIPIKDLLSAVESTVKALQPSWTFLTKQHHVETGPKHSAVTWDFHQKLSTPKPAFISVAIEILEDNPSAIKKAKEKVTMLERDPEDILTATPAEGYLAALHLVSKGGSNLNVLVYGNVLIQLDGCATPENIVTVSKAIDDFVKARKPAEPKGVAKDDVTIEFPDTVTVGDVFDIKITVSGVERGIKAVMLICYSHLMRSILMST
ncbi:uncharacterized protein BDZ99DRAFT_268196 [Mytilinidion resinicola]|uniref:Uncharacterized protein n=1 Tax=Mytilinidion resinicola TaxID=574789 RepID=A0A6A6YWX8_9PEZI|nr:uncharacterized protein BDZ99DRAFT_268196 [Mytilinidion resinicola]KAF2812504.1 hypothetical protein BDZ99DRAFT_268196 [Mytilinidion resinicola]